MANYNFDDLDSYLNTDNTAIPAEEEFNPIDTPPAEVPAEVPVEEPMTFGSVEEPLDGSSSGPVTQIFDDGSTLTTDEQGNVLRATDPEGNDITANYSGRVNTSGKAPVAKLPTSQAVKPNPQTGKTPLQTVIEGIKGIGTSVVNAIGQRGAGAAGGTLAALLTPQLTNLLSSGQYAEARKYIGGAVSGIQSVEGADLTKLTPQLQYQVMQGTMTAAQAQAAQASVERAVMQGTMTPAQGQAALQEMSGMAGVTTDAGSLAGQRAALQRLSEIGTQGGMTEADRAQLAATMNATNANAAQQRAAQIQQLQSQGLGGSGAELAARLSGVQGGANANAAAGANVATAAQARALQAIQAGLQGNAALNTQLFGQEAQKAQAQDVVNQYNAQARNAMTQANMANQQQSNLQNFNTANQIALANQAAANQMSQFNAGNQQAANIFNAGNQQAANLANFNMANQIAGTNTGIANEQAKLPMTVAQQSFTNKLNQATAGSNAGLTAGHLLNAQGNKIVDVASQLFGATNKLISPPPESTKAPTAEPTADLAAKNQGSSDERNKCDITPMSDDDVDNMFAKLTGYKYRYKGSKRQTEGVMAQDVEKTPMRQSVVDTPAGKILSGNEMIGQSMAALANLSQRIRKLEGK